MRINRERFLQLAWGMAVGAGVHAGCGGAAPQLVEAPIQVVDVSAKDDAGVAIARSGRLVEELLDGSVPPRVALADGDDDGDDDGPGLGENEPRVQNPPSQALSTCGPADNAKAGGTFTCPLRAPPGPACESFEDTQRECRVLTRVYSPRFAQKVGECIERKGKTREICQFDVTTDCLLSALSEICVEPTARASCNAVAKTCRGRAQGTQGRFTEDVCVAGASALPYFRRTRFMSCVTESCQVRSCLAEPMYNTSNAPTPSPVTKTYKPQPPPAPTPTLIVPPKPTPPPPPPFSPIRRPPTRDLDRP